MLLCWPCVSSCVYAPRLGPSVALRLRYIVLSVLAEGLPLPLGRRVASIHRAAEKEGVLGNWASGVADSRKLGSLEGIKRGPGSPYRGTGLYVFVLSGIKVELDYVQTAQRSRSEWLM